MKISLFAIVKSTSALVALLTVASIGIGSPAHAGEKPANYLAIKGGIYSPSNSFELDNFNNGTRTHIDSKTGIDGEVAIGHYFSPMLAVEVGSGYFESKGNAAAQPGETKLKVVPVLATGKVLFPLGIFEPYGEFGAGAYFTKLDVSGNTDNFSGSSKVTYGLHAGAGFNVALTDRVFVGLEGRYLWVRPSFGGQDINMNGFTTTANLGLRF